MLRELLRCRWRQLLLVRRRGLLLLLMVMLPLLVVSASAHGARTPDAAAPRLAVETFTARSAFLLDTTEAAEPNTTAKHATAVTTAAGAAGTLRRARYARHVRTALSCDTFPALRGGHSRLQHLPRALHLPFASRVRRRVVAHLHAGTPHSLAAASTAHTATRLFCCRRGARGDQVAHDALAPLFG